MVVASPPYLWLRLPMQALWAIDFEIWGRSFGSSTSSLVWLYVGLHQPVLVLLVDPPFMLGQLAVSQKDMDPPAGWCSGFEHEHVGKVLGTR